MAETRKITIEIIQKSEEGQPKPTPKEDETQKEKSNEGKTLLKSVILNQGYQTAKRLIKQSVDAGINNYIALSEDYFAEQTYNNVMLGVSKMTSGMSSIVSGATAGSVAGIGGMIIGGIIGAVGWGASEYISYQARMGGYYRTLNASIIEKDYAKRKAGYYDGGHGTEN